MKVSITATHRGVSTQQRLWWGRIVCDPDWVTELAELHHGGCIGGDFELAVVLKALRPDCKLVLHRGDTPQYWADMDEWQDEILDPKDNIERNHDMVDETQILFAFPGQSAEVQRSGTWATIRYARDRVNRWTIVCYPDGTFEEHNRPGELEAEGTATGGE